MNNSQNTQQVAQSNLIKALQEIGIIKVPDTWLLIDPFGNAYEGSVEKLMMLLAKEHPYLRNSPLSSIGV